MIENTMVTRVLLRDGEVAGVYAMDVETGEERVFPCKAAVIAAGSATRLYRLHELELPHHRRRVPPRP